MVFLTGNDVYDDLMRKNLTILHSGSFTKWAAVSETLEFVSDVFKENFIGKVGISSI